jgi:hypothetical protein
MQPILPAAEVPAQAAAVVLVLAELLPATIKLAAADAKDFVEVIAIGVLALVPILLFGMAHNVFQAEVA